MSNVVHMYDDTSINLIPANPQAVAAYVDGRYANFSAARSLFPNARIFSIAVLATDDAECLDCEPGDATTSQCPGWYRKQVARGLSRPCIYTSASNVPSLVSVMNGSGIARSDYRIWSAHYLYRDHICGPGACQYSSVQCDGTQWTDRSLNRSLDESTLNASFFGSSQPPDPSNWTDSMMANLPMLQLGPNSGNGFMVYRLQGLLVGVGKLRSLTHASGITIDGVFGQSTKDAVVAVQSSYGLTRDGVVGKDTWTKLIES